jgi:hypothetical protein
LLVIRVKSGFYVGEILKILRGPNMGKLYLQIPSHLSNLFDERLKC